MNEDERVSKNIAEDKDKGEFISLEELTDKPTKPTFGSTADIYRLKKRN